MINKRHAFFLAILLVTVVIISLLVNGGYHGNQPTALKCVGGASEETHPRDVKHYRFNDGRITIGSSSYNLSPGKLGAMSPKELEVLYENVVFETTADCSTARRVGRVDNGGWDLCVVGPFVPKKPCFSFSFGVNNMWEFDEHIAAAFTCQVLMFDPTMWQKSHMRNDKIAFFKEGLHGSKGTLNDWSVNTYLGFLKRFKAEKYVIDILKIEIDRESGWASLETALKDGSLRNVKQLMIETRISLTGSVQEFLRYFSIIKGIYDAGFRQWRHNWDIGGYYSSKLNNGEMRTCCHELHYINMNFLTDARSARNPSGSQITAPLSATETDNISKIEGYNQVDRIFGLNLSSLPAVNLETIYFEIVETEHVMCPNIVLIGDSGEGDWDVCFTGPYNLMNSKPCVAFSFGINNMWGYDDQLADKYHCNVHMFDPSMTAVNDYQRKATAWFYKTGLSSENKVESNGWKMRTLCTLFDELGYSGKPVDILKIDVEYWEWVSFEKAIQDGCLKQVKQLLFETHTSELLDKESDYARFIRIWRELFKLGFRTWKWHKNPFSVFYKPSGTQRACCYEHYMLNINFTEL